MQIKCFEIIDNSAFIFYMQSLPANKVLFFYSGKNKKLRLIPINKSLRELLLKLNLTRNGNRYVFENPKTGKPYMDLKRGWQSALEKAGIKNMRFHGLWHTFASHFLMNGGDLHTLKEILGHKDITTTSRYLTITTEHKSKAMEIFEVPENESNIIELAG